MADRPARGGARRPRVDPARLAAYDVLKAVRVDDAYANLTLPGLLRARDITGRDAAFATELVSGTIRRQGSYDPIIDACLTKPRLEAKVRDALRLGVHQLLSMRVPGHAAISTTVDLVRARVGTGPAGLTNAVLRKVQQYTLDDWLDGIAPLPGEGTPDHATLAVRHSHPRWVVDELARALAADGRAGELAALLEADNAAPRVMLVARPGLAGLDELAASGAVPTGRSPYAAELPGGDPGALPAVREGRAGVQDEGSQRVAVALAEAELSGSDQRWLDLCAGPGGKSALLAALAAGRGARLLANERAPHRAALVAENLRATTAGVLGVVTADGTAPPWQPGTFDRVLVDAPCSGLGALRRRPESRWRRTRADLDELVALQTALLEAALDSVRLGGVVGYATCSPVLAETRDVVERVLGGRAHGGRGDVALLDTEQLWPHADGTDAMYLALLRRTA